MSSIQSTNGLSRLASFSIPTQVNSALKLALIVASVVAVALFIFKIVKMRAEPADLSAKITVLNKTKDLLIEFLGLNDGSEATLVRRMAIIEEVKALPDQAGESGDIQADIVALMVAFLAKKERLKE